MELDGLPSTVMREPKNTSVVKKLGEVSYVNFLDVQKVFWTHRLITDGQTRIQNVGVAPF